jgi:hypothetical protein
MMGAGRLGVGMERRRRKMGDEVFVKTPSGHMERFDYRYGRDSMGDALPGRPYRHRPRSSKLTSSSESRMLLGRDQLS